MVFGLGKKKEGSLEEPYGELAPPPSMGPPTDMVLNMRQQGFTNNQIVQALQRDGYASDQIFDAMNQADIKAGTSSPSMAPVEPEPIGPPPMQPLPTQAPPQKMPEPSEQRNNVEELVEVIIDEKWSDFSENVNKVVEWKNKTEARIDNFEKNLNALQARIDDLHKAVLGKVSEYDKHVTDIGTGLKAMELVFKKSMPTFTQNINELSRLVKNTKKIPKKKS